MKQITKYEWYDDPMKPTHLISVCQLPYSVHEIENTFDISFSEYLEDGLGLCFGVTISVGNHMCLLTGFLDRNDKDSSVLVQVKNTEKNLIDFVEALCEEFKINKDVLTWQNPDLHLASSPYGVKRNTGFHAETGLFYNYFRSYDPKTGRYTQSDPIGIQGGLNTFGYVDGNPVNTVDPTGLAGVSPATKGVCAALLLLEPTPASELLCSCIFAYSAVNGMLNEIPKSPTGKGAVPPDQREPKRVYTKDEKQGRLDENGGTCESCGNDLDIDDADGHHKKRWADGGRTVKEELAVVCKPCHKKLHSK